MELTLDQALKQGVKAHQAGRLQEANKVYGAILQAQPKHPDANHNMGMLSAVEGNIKQALPFFKTALETKPSVAQFWLSYIDALIKLDRYTDAKAVFDQAKKQGAKGDAFAQLEKQLSKSDAHPQDPNSKQLQPIIDLYTRGLLKQALFDSKKMLEIFPNSLALYNLCGAVNMGLAQFNAAVDNYTQAIKIDPNNAEHYYNMGVAFSSKGDLDAAISSYTQALKFKPDYTQVHSNLGVALKDKGHLEAAIDSYKQALKTEPNNAGAQSNLLDLLTSYTPKKEDPNPIVAVNETIRNIDIKKAISMGIISDAQVVGLFTKAAGHIISSGIEVRTGRSQTYRKSTIDLNCDRHKLIFKEQNIIPEFCFGCYKVQVEPRSIIELIKLYLVFEQLELDENNNRKCMIELRPAISGFYKGLIFCSGLKQANQIADRLNSIVKQRIGSGLPAIVKRGCSEYPIAFPDYKEINHSGPQLMNYNNDWKVVEDNHDRKAPARTKGIMPSSSGLNLRDLLVIQRWLDYARGIGDPSADLINQNPVRDQRIYNLAKARLDLFHFNN